MPKRIYKLAKELNLDSKDLMEICSKVGIQGKGSALASLSDEEEQKVRKYLANLVAGPAQPRPPATPVVKDSKVRVLPSRRPSKPAPAKPEATPPPAEPAPAAPTAEPPAREEKPAAAESPAPSQPAPPPSAPAAAPPLSAMLPSNRVRTLTPKSKEKRSDAGKPKEKSKGRTPPVIRVAIPKAKQPELKPPKKKEEPAPQKPVIALPPDAIREAKSGGGALRDRVRQLTQRFQEQQQADTAEPVAPARGKGKGRKGEEERRGGRPVSREERRQRRRQKNLRAMVDEEQETARPVRRTLRKTGANTAAPRKREVKVTLPCTVRSFSEALGVPAAKVLMTLLKLGQRLTINSNLDPDLAELVAAELGVEAQFRREVPLEEEILARFQQEPDPESLRPRPPVVTFLGHVDHGKTSLLDRIIGTHVVETEAGGITQHIRAYQVEKDGRLITFIDTPGHEAFTAMRARGANVTDVVVLVVAADDGVMPQTEEAISHAKAAGVPIVVALNKIDLPGANVDRCLQQLSAHELLPSEWGGDVEVIRTSAVTGEGIDQLLETLLTLAELHEFKAPYDGPATGTCLEAQRHEGLGVVAKLLVQRGTLRTGDVLLCGPAYGRARVMKDTLRPDRKLDQAPPSTPVDVIGLQEVPGAGDQFYVLEDISVAREIAEERQRRQREESATVISAKPSLERLQEFLASKTGEVKSLNLIIRADTRGSIEAILKELGKLEHPEVQVKVVQALVGGITEGDVHLADACDAVIVGFNVAPDENARALAKERGVEIRRYNIIYNLTDDLRAALEGMLQPQRQQRELGRAHVLQVFRISKVGNVAGCRVVEGVIRRGANVKVRVIRNNTVIGEYALESLRREKQDVNEVREGMECGIKLANFNDVKQGDVLEAYMVEEVARTLETASASS